MMNYYNCLKIRPGTDFRRTWRTSLALLAFFVMFGVQSIRAQVDVSSSGGPLGATTFTTLKAAFDNINSGSFTGAVTIGISGDTSETATAVLNASGTGSASYTSVSITPTGGAARTISGAITAGSALIQLNGADNVTINGLNTGGNSLTISNTTVASTAGTSTIKFNGDATGNTVTNCSIQGSSTTASATEGGVIVFSTGTTSGNDGNTISNNDIGPAGSNLPSKLIWSVGSTTNATIYNSGNTATGNNMHDYFLASGDCHGFYVQGGNSDWTITNNKIYQTASRTFTTSGSRMYGINFNYSNANNVQITGNTFGYASSASTGTMTILGNGAITAVYFLASSTAANACNINNNTVSNIAFTGTTGTFLGLNNGTSSSSSTLNFNNNVIRNIALTGTTGSAYGISWASGTNISISNNQVYNISRDTAGSIYGLTSSSSSTNETVNGNIIHDFTSTAAGSQTFYGIYQLTASGTKLFQNNQVYNFTANGGTTMYGVAASYGTTLDMSGNVVYGFSNLGGTGGTTYGIYRGSTATTANVYNNKVYDLASTSTGPSIYGIYHGSATSNIYNNLVGDLRATAAAGPNAIAGVYISGGTAVNLYYNTVYLTGTSSGSNFGTAAVYVNTTPTVTMNNNILINNTVPTGTGFAAVNRRSGTTLTSYANASNNNMFYGSTVYYDGTTAISSMATYKTTVSPRDAQSVYENPTFLSTTGSSSNFLHLDPSVATQAESGGTPIAGITTDFDGNTRNASTPDIGASEFAGTTPAPLVTINSLTPSVGQCTATGHLVNATVTTSTGTITGVSLNYAYNGVAQTPIAMTNPSGTLWQGTIPAATPTNAVVTWSVTATNSVPLTGTASGTSYQDDPNVGVSAVATVSSATVCSGSPTTLTVTTASVVPATYANPPAVSNATTDEDLGNVTITQGATTILNNSSTRNSLVGTIGTAAGTAGSYSDFTAFGPYSLTAGQTYNFSLSSLQNTTAYSNSMAIYIDYNRNGVFTDPGEAVYVAGSTSSGAHTETGSFTVPSGAFGGITRMRIISNEGLVTGPTMSVSYGEYEDYKINISSAAVGGGAAPAITSVSWSDGTTTVGTGASLVISPTSSATYTATATVSGCPLTSNGVSVTVNPLPTAPIASDSSQCGDSVPTASVLDPNGFATPTFNWYADPTGGTALQSSTSTTYATSISATTTFYVSVINPATSCESARTAVTVTVVAPDAVSASSSAPSVCLGSGVTLTATNTASSPTNNYTYSWQSTAAGSGAETPVAGNPVSITPTAVGSYTYTVTAFDPDTNCTTTAAVTVMVGAVPTIVANATNSTICGGSSTNITAAVGGAGLAASIGTGTSTTGNTAEPTAFENRWPNYVSQTIYTAAELQAAGLTAGNITSMAYNIISSGSAASNANFTVKIGTTASSTFANTNFLDTTGYTTVFGPATYNHTASGMQTVNFTTPFVWDGTSNIVVFVSMDGADITYNAETYYSTATDKTLWKRSYSLPLTTGTLSANRLNVVFGGIVGTTTGYTFTWNPGNLTGASQTVSPADTTTYTVTAANDATGCSNTQTVTVNVNPQPTAPTATNSSQCGTAVPTASVADTNGFSSPTFTWYTAASGGTVAQASTSTTYTSSISATTTFYVTVKNPTTNCESTRTPVTITVAVPDAISASASSSTICVNTPVTLTATNTASSPTQNYTYTWTSTAGSGASGAGVTGNPASITPTAGGTYTYTVTGIDGSCSTTATVTVTVTAPTVNSVTATPSAVCSGQPSALTFSAPMNFATSTGASLNAMTGATQVIGSSVDDTPMSAPAAIGFNFVFNGTVYTQFSASPDGWMLLGGATASSQYTNSVTSTTNIPKLYPYWDDLATGTDGNVSTLLTGTAPNRIFIVQWHITSPRNTGGASDTTFQAWLYEGSNKIEYRYGAFGGPSGSASVGYTGSATSFGSITLSSNSYSNSTANNSNADAPASGRMFTLTPLQTTWTPTTNLFTDAAATVPYTGGDASLVYATPSAQTTYTANITSGAGCTLMVPVTVDVNPAPTAPTATNSTQCGNGVPAASVADTNGFTSPTFKWYDAATGGTLLQSGTATAYGTSISATTTFYVSVTDPSTGCESPRAAVTVTVTAPDAIVLNPGASTSGCANQALGLSVSSSNGSYVYTWTANPEAGSGITGSVTGASPSITPTAAGVYTYTISASDGTCNTSATITATVNASPATVASATLTTVCAGSPTSLSASSGDLPVNPLSTGFETTGWTISNPGTGNSWAYSTGTSAHTGNGYLSYSYNSSSAANTWAISPASVLTGGVTYTITYWYKTASISGAYPENLKLTVGNAATVAAQTQVLLTQTGLTTETYTQATATFTPGSSGNYYFGLNCFSDADENVLYVDDFNVVGPTLVATYAWTSSPAGFTSTQQSPGAVSPTVTTTYTVTATAGGCSTSSSVTVNVNDLPAFTVADATICNGGSTTLSAVGTGNIYSWSPATGLSATTGSSVTANPTITTTYTVTATSNTTGCQSSHTVTVTVNNPPVFTDVDGFGISPLNPTAFDGQTVTFTSSATGTGITYQWYVDDGTGFAMISGETGSSLSVLVDPSMSGYQYHVVVSGTSPCGSITSANATLNVDDTGITAQPQSTTVCLGDSASFTVGAASSDPEAVITYDWYLSTDSGVSFNPITDGVDATVTGYNFTGAQTSSLTLDTTTLASNGWVFQVYVNGYILSDNATLTVKTPPSISPDVDSDVFACANSGTAATFSVGAAGDDLTYQWQVSTDDGISWNNLSNGAGVAGATAVTLSLTNIPAAWDNYLFHVIVSGYATCSPATSAAGKLHVNNVAVTTPPANVTAPAGTSATLTVTASGTGLSYDWQYYNGTAWASVANNTPAGYTYSAAGSSLQVNVPGTEAAGTRQYRVAVSAGACSATSTAATLTVTTYCASAAGSDGDEDITNVVFGTLSNASACASLTGTQGTGTGTANRYTNFTAAVAAPSIQAGASTPISVEITECAGSAYGHSVNVYIDLNHNGLLTDSGETFVIWPYASSNTHTISSSILIPATAMSGNTLMRVVCKESATNVPCSVTSWGETEDYTINILPAPACSGTPVAGTVTSSNDVCTSGTSTLTLTGLDTSVTGLSVQWYDTVSGAISGATGTTYTTPTLTSAASYFARVTCANSGLTADSNTVTVNVQTPSVSGTTPGSRCGTGTVDLAATASSGNLFWFAAATGGSPLYMGSNFTTPVISATTTYYVENNIGGESGSVGVTAAAASTNGTSTGSHGIMLTTTVPNVKISSIDIPFTGTGTITIALKDTSASTVFASAVSPTVTGSGLTKVTVPFNLTIATPGSYTLVVNAVSGSVGALGYTDGATYPTSSLSGGITVTSGYWYGSTTSNMYLYNLAVSTGCSSSRTPVVATVNTPPALTLSSSSAAICTGSTSGLITISAGLASYDTFTWSPSTGVSGTAASGYTFTGTAGASYTLNASDSTSGCATSATFILNVNELPSGFTLSPATSSACSADVNGVALTVAGATGQVYTQPMDTLPSNFTLTNTAGTGSVTLNTTYHNQGSGSVLLTTASVSANVSYAMNTNVNLGGTASAQLTFDHIAGMEGSFSAYDYGYVEYSTNGGTSWTTFPSSAYVGTASLYSSQVKFSTLSYSDWTANFTSSGAVPNNSLWKSETVNIPAAALSSSQFRIRFRYTTDSSTNYYGWLIDNVKIKTASGATVTWSPTSGLYTDAAATTAYAGGNATTVYAKPASTNVYTATVTDTTTGCSSTATATVNVVESPTVVAPADQAYCEGSLTSAITLTSTPATGVSYNITGGAAVGLPNLSGVTNIPAFTAVAGSATVTITPMANGCTGNAVTYNILVSPQTVAGTVTGGGNTVCTGSNSGLLTLSGNTGSVVRWESSVAPFSVWTPIAVTTSTYTSGPLSETTQFRAVVKSGSCVEVATNAVTVTVNAVTLASVTSAQVCQNTEATVALNGLVPNSTMTVAYTKSGVAQTPVNLTADASGMAMFNVLVTGSGQNVVITQITRTDVSPSCPWTPTSNNSVTFVLSTGCSNLVTQCGVTLPTIDTPIYTTIVSGAQAYRWRVTNLNGPNLGLVQTLDTPLRTMKLVQLANYAFATQYQIEIATLRSGVWGPFGVACSVTTPSPTTALTSCGQLLTTISDNVYANIVGYAAGYKFRVTDPVSPTNTQEIIRPIRDFKLTMVTAFTVSYGKTYNVEVAVKNTDGTYLPYGTVCTVTTPSFPTTSVQDSQCDGYLVPTANTQVYAISYPGAIAYAFHFSGGNLGSTGVEIVNPVRSFTVAQIPGWAPAQTYDVKVRLIFNESDLPGPYGKVCTIVTPGLSRPIESETAATHFDAIAYPNPFAETFDIKVTTADADNVSVTVYDMAGRLLETRSVKVSQVESLHIGDRYPSGVYNVIVTQGDHVKTLRVIKR